MELTATPMPTLLVRICLICHHLNALLLYVLPKKLFSLLSPSSWHPPPSKDTSASPGAASTLLSPRCSARQQLTLSPAPTDPSELRRVFHMFDRNGDGRITKKELTDSLENLGIYISDADLASVIERIDADGDGCVDVDEFAALYRAIMDGLPGGEEEEEEMREAFEVFDQNGDGFITVEELRSVLASFGIKQGRTTEDCKRMISTVDADGNGMVDFKEFKQMMKGERLATLE
ncbi:calmodulin-like protein 3 [Canna indica]|uniref:Calmodulin-like protein 3 n=1 Tax=Canna indica TaxID=4628 RepID=A0AAQ3KTT2_9LILI|nr:calmodulin-like protein 3 [Canna indica]